MLKFSTASLWPGRPNVQNFHPTERRALPGSDKQVEWMTCYSEPGCGPNHDKMEETYSAAHKSV